MQTQSKGYTGGKGLRSILRGMKSEGGLLGLKVPGSPRQEGAGGENTWVPLLRSKWSEAICVPVLFLLLLLLLLKIMMSRRAKSLLVHEAGQINNRTKDIEPFFFITGSFNFSHQLPVAMEGAC